MIIPSPEIFDYEALMRDDTNKQMEISSENQSNFNNYTLLAYTKEKNELKFAIEAFIHNIIFNILQLKKQQREKNYNCILCLDFMLHSKLKDIYELIVKTLLDNSLIITVKLIPKNILPIFTSGYSSGIVIDVGYLFTTIVTINNGFHSISETIPIGSFELERYLKRAIIEENIKNTKRKIKNPEIFLNNIHKHLNDLVTRCTICVNKKISIALEDSNDDSKLKKDQFYSRVDYCKNLQDFYVSYITRVRLGEKLFGNFNRDEINIAYSLLNVIKNINCEDRKKLSQNIILSGGTSMLMGFYRRFIEEIYFIIDTEEFENIKQLRNFIKVHKIIFQRNCLTWIGASLISGFEKINFKHLSLAKDDFEGIENIESNSKKENKDPLGKIFSFFK